MPKFVFEYIFSFHVDGKTAFERKVIYVYDDAAGVAPNTAKELLNSIWK